MLYAALHYQTNGLEIGLDKFRIIQMLLMMMMMQTNKQ